MIRILIADDHPLVLAGLRDAISKAPDMTVVAEASNGREVVDKARREDLDLIVLDFNMPHLDGLDILKELNRERKTLPVLILSQYPEDQLAVRTLKAGAAGYMTKECTGTDLLDAIRLIHAGGKYISNTLAQQLVLTLEDQEKDGSCSVLSDREYQVFRLLVTGKSVDTIAQILSISDKTVRTYRGRIMQKIHVCNDVELTLYAVDHHLINSR